MTDSIVQTSENVTLVGASKANKGILADALAIAPFLVAADGGAEMLLKYGKTPKKVIGDFDSIGLETLKQFSKVQLFKIPDQDTTDFEKCLNNIESPLILGVGFLGRRVDHQLAAFNALVRYADKRCILISKFDIIFHLPKAIKLSLTPGSRFSLFPMATVTGRSTGLKWPISGLHFAPDAKIGTSNEVSEPDVRLEMDSSGMLAILPRVALPAAVSALQAT